MERLTALLLKLLAVVAVAGACTAHAAYISDVHAAASSFLAGSDPDDAVRGEGMLAGLRHDAGSANAWISKSGDKTGYFIVDLKRVHPVTAIDVWNHNQTSYTTRGVKDLNVDTSNDGISWVTQMANIQLPQANGATNYFGTRITLPRTINTRYVRLDILSNWGDASYTGLSEVRVQGLGSVAHTYVFGDPYAVSSSKSSTSNTIAYIAAYACDGSGLTSSTNGIGLKHNASTTAGSWLSKAGTVSNQWVRFDLGTTRTLGSLAVWNWNGNNGTSYAGRGIQAGDIEFYSASDTLVSSMPNFAFLMGAGDANYDSPQVITLGDGIACRYVKIKVRTNYGQDTTVGLAEVKFYGLAPYQLPTVQIPATDGGGVTNAFVADRRETTVAAYVALLNAQTNGTLVVTNGEVRLSAGAELLCLTTAAAAEAPVVYTATNAPGSRFAAAAGRAAHPMTHVSWFGAAQYCNWRSAAESVTPRYDVPNGWTLTTATGYRLPTEAEWLKAAAWDTTNQVFFVYGTATNSLVNTSANFLNSGDAYEANTVRTAPVASYPGRSLYGLRDASGNVWEWCQDFYTPDGSAPASDPHAVRGGSWGNLPADCKTQSRCGNKPGQALNTVGFRVVKSSI